MGIEKNPKNNDNHETEEDKQSAEAETKRLLELLRNKEQHTQRLREMVANQRRERQFRLTGRQAELAKRISEEDNDEKKNELQKELDKLRHSDLKTRLSSDVTSFELDMDKADDKGNSKIWDKLDAAIKDVKKNQDSLESLEQTKQDLKEMESGTRSNDVMKRIYEQLIEIADNIIANQDSSEDVLLTAVKCKNVLKSRLDTLNVLMELEKKNPEFQDLSPQMDALLLTDDI